MRRTARLLVAAVVGALALGGCAGGDGGLGLLTADPVMTMDVPGAHETARTTDKGGTVFGKRTLAQATRTLEPDDGVTTDEVFDAVVDAARDAGWEADIDGSDDSGRYARLDRTVDGTYLQLDVDQRESSVRVALSSG